MIGEAAVAAPGPKRSWRDVDGILLLDKPLGRSSNAALQRVRRLYRARKAGHTGSLDPLATGLLPLCFGEATKVSGLLLDADKTYRATLALGRATATGDAEGEVVAEAPVLALDPGGVQRAMAGLTGPLLQRPPMYSALKHDGRRLYELARQGVEVEREPRPIVVHELNLTGLADRTLCFEARVSKGTYIRTLGEDLARALGTVGHLSALRRTSLGPFAGQQLRSVDELEALAGEYGEAALDALLLPIDAALVDHPAVTLDAGQARSLRHGQVVAAQGPAGCRVRAYGPDCRFLGIAAVAPDGAALSVVRLLATDR